MRAFNIKAKKRDLGKAKREIRKKVAELKEVTFTLQCFKYFFLNTTTANRIKKGVACFFYKARSVEYSTSKETQENITKTFQDLELTAKVLLSLKE